MEYEDLKALSSVRLDHAEECLNDAKQLLQLESYKSAANRSYYAVFHAMRAVLAFDQVDMKHHSGVIGEFRRRYIKTDLLDKRLSPIISALSDIRTNSDYDDFFVISKAQVRQQVENADMFLKCVKAFLNNKGV